MTTTNLNTGTIVIANEDIIKGVIYRADKALRGDNPKPKPSCRKCHGRGYIGKNLQTGMFMPCKCVK